MKHLFGKLILFFCTVELTKNFHVRDGVCKALLPYCIKNCSFVFAHTCSITFPAAARERFSVNNYQFYDCWKFVNFHCF